MERGADGAGCLNAGQIGASHQPSASEPPAALPPPAPPRPGCLVRVGDFGLQGGTVSFADNAQPRPVALDLIGPGRDRPNLASDGSKPEAFTLTPARRQARATPRPAGKIDYRGTLACSPGHPGKLDATRLPGTHWTATWPASCPLNCCAPMGLSGPKVAFAQTTRGPA